MGSEQIASMQPAPAEGWLKCAMCGFDLKVKKGQLVPPCPRCSARKFEPSEGPTECA